MGPDTLQVTLDQLRVTAAQWRGRSADLTAATSPAAGPSFQATSAAVAGVNTKVGIAAAALAARTQATAAGVDAAVAGYRNQEAAATGEMAAVPRAIGSQ
ncbi:hypothetical protein [Mycobacterium sp. MUNTM1]